MVGACSARGTAVWASCYKLSPVMLAVHHATHRAASRLQHRHCPAGVHNSFTREATDPERAALIRLGSVKPRAPKALLVSVSTAVQACARLALHNTLVSSLGGVCAHAPALDMTALQQPASPAGLSYPVVQQLATATGGGQPGSHTGANTQPPSTACSQSPAAAAAMSARVDCVAIPMHNASPVAISRVIDEGGQVSFGARKLYNKLVAGYVSWCTWRDIFNGGCLICQSCRIFCLMLPPVTVVECQQIKAASAERHAQSCAALIPHRCRAGVHGSFTRDATLSERAALIRLGSLKARAPRALLLSRSTAVRAVTRLSLHSTVVSSLEGVCADTPALDMAVLQQPVAAAGGGQPLIICFLYVLNLGLHAVATDDCLKRYGRTVLHMASLQAVSSSIKPCTWTTSCSCYNNHRLAMKEHAVRCFKDPQPQLRYCCLHGAFPPAAEAASCFVDHLHAELYLWR